MNESDVLSFFSFTLPFPIQIHSSLLKLVSKNATVDPRFIEVDERTFLVLLSHTMDVVDDYSVDWHEVWLLRVDKNPKKIFTTVPSTKLYQSGVKNSILYTSDHTFVKEMKMDESCISLVLETILFEQLDSEMKNVRRTNIHKILLSKV